MAARTGASGQGWRAPHSGTWPGSTKISLWARPTPASGRDACGGSPASSGSATTQCQPSASQAWRCSA
ncbi:hypothetical protein, partial [Bordetella pertussis]|uniref:hypothetical protein n=1 Tax=Bordetella pertussis TaxID=520 RepID=UPI00367195E1